LVRASVCPSHPPPTTAFERKCSEYCYINLGKNLSKTLHTKAFRSVNGAGKPQKDRFNAPNATHREAHYSQRDPKLNRLQSLTLPNAHSTAPAEG
jgi:hypothetical protein